MDVQDFFYLARYDTHFVENFMSQLIHNKMLKRHYSTNGVHYFDLHFSLDENFIFDNFGTRNINEVTLIRLSKACIQNATTIQPMSDLINEVRVKSNYYPVLKNAKIYLDQDDSSKMILISYKVTIMLVPDHM